jgi:hypothetical protein
MDTQIFTSPAAALLALGNASFGEGKYEEAYNAWTKLLDHITSDQVGGHTANSPNRESNPALRALITGVCHSHKLWRCTRTLGSD